MHSQKHALSLKGSHFYLPCLGPEDIHTVLVDKGNISSLVKTHNQVSQLPIKTAV
jgi:hypothetical protein